MSSWFNFDFFVCWMRTQPWNLNLYEHTKCSLAARSHIPTQNSNVDWQVGLRNLKPLFTWQKILHRQFVTEEYYFRYAFVFIWKISRWTVLKILGANFLARAPGQVLPLPPLSTLMPLGMLTIRSVNWLSPQSKLTQSIYFSISYYLWIHKRYSWRDLFSSRSWNNMIKLYSKRSIFETIRLSCEYPFPRTCARKNSWSENISRRYKVEERVISLFFKNKLQQ